MTTSGAPLRPRCGCVDVHTHVVPASFPPYLGRHANAPWPSTAPAHACHRHVVIGGKPYRTVSDQCWDTEVRLRDMDRSGTSRQVLSPMPELLSYWLAPEDGATMCRYLNETIASMVASAPDRLSGLGAVPLQDVDRAIDELEHATGALGLAGVEIGSNVEGVPIGDPRFRPFFEACAQRGAAVFVHALRADTARLVGPPVYEQAVAFPAEIGLAAMSMITGGTFVDVPGLRIAFSHGGGALQVMVPRLQHAWEAIPAVRDALRESPRATARRMYYDDLLYDARAIEALVQLVGPTQVMAGTDYPFSIMDADPVGRIASLALDPDVRTMLLETNALRWLGDRSAPLPNPERTS